MGWCAAGYVASCALAIGVVPLLYPPAKWCARARARLPMAAPRVKTSVRCRTVPVIGVHGD